MSRYSESGQLSEDPRAQKTRQKLKQALIEIMGEKDFTAISVNDVTKAAKINRATFYSHYNDKHELLNSIVSDTFSQMMVAYSGDNLSLNDDTLHAFIMSVWEYIGFFSTSIGGGSGDQFISLMQAEVQKQTSMIVNRWLQEDISNKTDLEAIASAISGMIFNTGAYWGKAGEESGIQEMSMTIRNLIIHGLKHSRFKERDAQS